jgi:NAD(P)H-dependent FMN reductase
MNFFRCNRLFFCLRDVLVNYIKLIKNITICSIFTFLFIGCLQSTKPSEIQESKKRVPMKLSIIVGTVRATPTGKLIAQNLVNVLKHRSDITTEVLYVGDYHLPFYTDPVSPSSWTGDITDPILKKWSDAIAESAAFIIVSPDYNGGYPAPLKNALDSLYTEWNHKPAGIVGYSGGLSGGTSMIKQLQQVFERLEMISVATSIKIPQSWKAFNPEGTLVAIDTIKKELNIMVDELIDAVKN